MLRYQRLVVQMQNVLYASVPCERARIEALAGEYAAACEEVNQRLRRVVEHLRAGEPQQAREELERAPQLLDLVALLEFAELPQWCQRLYELELAAPPRLLVENAAELNEALGEAEPLEVLLKSYRLLVLAHAPLTTRILTLRLIWQLDRQDSGWHADLLALEQARLQEIQASTQRLYQLADLEGLETLHAELTDPNWVTSIPAELVQRVARYRTQLIHRG